MFFAPRNPDTALGMYSVGYFITLGIVLVLITLLLYISKKCDHKKVKRIIFTIGIILWITEFIKMLFTGITYGINDVEWIPLYFCSMGMYACILIMFKNEYLQKAGLSFMFFGGIIGAIAFFCYPDACIPNYPLFHFMTLRTFFYHGVMIYLGLLIVITGFYKPSIKDFKYYAVFFIIVFVLAYIINRIDGCNLMYISYPLNLSLSQILFKRLGILYPFIFGIGQIIGPFFVSYGLLRIYGVFKLNKQN